MNYWLPYYKTDELTNATNAVKYKSHYGKPWLKMINKYLSVRLNNSQHFIKIYCSQIFDWFFNNIILNDCKIVRLIEPVLQI